MEQRMYMTNCRELAKLMGKAKETLFHYDEIGLVFGRCYEEWIPLL